MTRNGSTMSLKTVVVLGGAYGGARAAQLIAAGLPDGWRIVLIDRNSHVNHVYILPRLAVLAGHEHKAFVPYDNIFNCKQLDLKRHIFLRAHIQSLGPNSVKLSRAFPEHGIDSDTLHFDYAIYALGSHLPSPLNLWHAAPDGKPSVQSYGGSKAESIAWLRGKQRAIEDANSVLVVGGGALGIQFATDIAAVYPGKPVTLLHSRTRLLPRFDSEMHTEVLQAMESANINVILGERLDLVSSTSGHSTVRTTTGRIIHADLVLLCTGQRPNTELLQSLDSRTVNTNTALAQVLRTMQLALVPPPPPPSPVTPALLPACASTNEEDVLTAALAQIALQNESASSAEEGIEASDDEDSPLPTRTSSPSATRANAFGAIPAGHNAYYQAEVAARNVLRLVHGKTDEPLERYTPGPPAIKVSLGLVLWFLPSSRFLPSLSPDTPHKKNVYQVNGVVGVGKETQDDLNAAAIWGYFGSPVVEEPEMFR
ncbi:apoptosis-inducing factor B [Favolaschia claudopus]|uniref:Apoptosis-inducing factor B n=1 Tax=Favolaschia claudopus TaxID=2862362 RepID=A0AAW0A8D1_9AGAR